MLAAGCNLTLLIASRLAGQGEIKLTGAAIFSRKVRPQPALALSQEWSQEVAGTHALNFESNSPVLKAFPLRLGHSAVVNCT